MRQGNRTAVGIPDDKIVKPLTGRRSFGGKGGHFRSLAGVDDICAPGNLWSNG